MPDPSDTDIPRVGGRSNALRSTNPLRPLRLVIVIVEAPKEPWKTVSDPAWDEDAERLTGPLNPFRAVTNIAVLPIVPALSWRKERSGRRPNEVPVT